MSNLINPMERQFLYGLEKDDSVPSVQTVSRAFYDRLLTKDPMTLYVINDTGEVFRGDLPIYPIRRINPHQRYLYVKRVDAGFEYVIVEDRESGMIEICSYKDPQDALDFLTRSNAPIDVASNLHEIEETLRNYRSGLLDMAYTIIGIMGVVSHEGNNGSIISDLMAIFCSYPYSRNPSTLTRDTPEYRELYRKFSYSVYSYIWNFLNNNEIQSKTFDSQDEEDKWLHKATIELLSGLLRTFSAR